VPLARATHSARRSRSAATTTCERPQRGTLKEQWTPHGAWNGHHRPPSIATKLTNLAPRRLSEQPPLKSAREKADRRREQADPQLV